MTEREALGCIIWSADVEDRAAMTARLDRMPDLRWVKVDRLYLDTTHDWDVFDFLRDRGIDGFCDGKISEVPSKVAKVAKAHCSHRPRMANIMVGGVCSSGLYESTEKEQADGLRIFADICREAGVLSCGVTVLTSKQPRVIKREYNGRSGIEQVLVYAEMMHEFGLTDVVCAAPEAEAIRANPEFSGLTLNCPGVRMPGSSHDDQARVASPAEAIMMGAARLVIGRDLTDSDDPAARLARIVEHLCEGVSI